MIYKKPNKKIKTVKINLPEEQKQLAKEFAKSHNYSFQDWLGLLVCEELQRNGILKKDIDTP